METSREDREMLSLSLISYLGFYETSYGVQASKRTYDSVVKALKAWSSVAGEWQLVWGPAHYRIPLTIFDENLMFVARSASDPGRYAIAIRGTNPVSVANWVLEDFSVVMKTPWPYSKPADLEPKVSKATAIGLQALQHMTPVNGLPGSGLTLYQFMAGELVRNTSPRVTVAVTGHSLGGALAPAVALWLADTQRTSDDPSSPPWDPSTRASIEVYSFAGPSPGDKDFAAYYDQRLGPVTRRLWNPYDVVPHGWSMTSLKKLPKLYDPHVSPDLVMRVVLWGTTLLARYGNYLHVREETPPLVGAEVQGLLKDYFLQLIYQHTAAYSDLLDLTRHVDLSAHFRFDDKIKAAIAETRRRRWSSADGPTIDASSSPGYAAASELATPAPARVPRALHHLYRMPGTIVRFLLPEAVSLSKMRRRIHHHHKQRGASGQEIPPPPRAADQAAQRDQHA